VLNIYKQRTGSNLEPKIRVSLLTDELNFENPIQFVAAAGVGFESSPIDDLYLFNDSTDIDYTALRIFVVDNDTSDQIYELSWLQFRVLDDWTNLSPRWSDWASVVEIDTVFGTSRKLTYYKDATTQIRDSIHFQARVSIPYNTQTQLKDDLSVSLAAVTVENTNPAGSEGRP
jgi:hypothetical protein